MSADATFRLAVEADLPSLAAVYLAARETAAMPPLVQARDEVRAWVASWDLSASDVWLAEAGGAVLGFVKLTPTWCDALYVLPQAQRAGIGSDLVELSKSLRPEGFGLWVFEANTPARAFYSQRGFVELERTEGHANEEGAPDVKMVWPGADPLAYYRSLIDETDLVLADVLARRAALTRVVQHHKRSVHVGLQRDAAREAEIAERMARVVPELGRERIARIMDAIISESVDAAR